MVEFINNEQIRTELRVAYSYIVVPVGMLDAPVEVEKMKLVDGGYGTLNQLSNTLGTAFKPVSIIDERFAVFRWLLATNRNSESNMVAFLESKGLVNFYKELDSDASIVPSELDGNEFGVFDALSIKGVPKPEEKGE